MEPSFTLLVTPLLFTASTCRMSATKRGLFNVLYMCVSLRQFFGTYLMNATKKKKNPACKHQQLKKKKKLKHFTLGWTWKENVTVQQRKTQRINHDIHEAFDFKLDGNVFQINSLNKQKCHISCFLHFLSSCLRFDWGSLMTSLSCPLFLWDYLRKPNWFSTTSCLTRWTNSRYSHKGSGWKHALIYILSGSLFEFAFSWKTGSEGVFFFFF